MKAGKYAWTPRGVSASILEPQLFSSLSSATPPHVDLTTSHARPSFVRPSPLAALPLFVPSVQSKPHHIPTYTPRHQEPQLLFHNVFEDRRLP